MTSFSSSVTVSYLPLWPRGYSTCLDGDRTGVQILAWSHVDSNYIIGLISRADTEGLPMPSLNCHRGICEWF